MITKNAHRDDLELEAEEAEQIAEYEEDPIMTVEVYGNRYRFRRSKIKGYAKAIANDIKDWMIQQKTVKSDEDYLKLLCSYEKWIKERM